MIRIELHDSDSDDYGKLHDSLRNANIFRIIQDIDTEKYYILPRGLYHYEGMIEEMQEMINLVKLIVKQITIDCEIIVTKSIGSMWNGLEKVED